MIFVCSQACVSHIPNPMNESINYCMSKIEFQLALIQYPLPAWRYQLQQAREKPPFNIEFRCPLGNDPHWRMDGKYCVIRLYAIGIPDSY